VAGYDSSLLQVSRACTNVTLADGASSRVDLLLRVLPECRGRPSNLDVMIVLDASATMAKLDPRGKVIDGVMKVIVDPMSAAPGTAFGVVAFGDGLAAHELAPPEEPAKTKMALGQLAA